MDEVTAALGGFEARFAAAWQAGQAALEATRPDGDAEKHLNWALSSVARFRLRVLDGEKLPGDPGGTRADSSLGSVDEADPRRQPLVQAVRDLSTYFDAGLGLPGWDWSQGLPPGWVEAAAALDDGPQPWDLPGPEPSMIQPMRWRRRAPRAGDPLRPDRPAIEASARQLAARYAAARDAAVKRAGSRKYRKIPLPHGIDAVEAIRGAQGNVVSGDWYPGSLFPLLDVRLRVVLNMDPKVAAKALGNDLHGALSAYVAFVEDQRFGLPAWPWSAGPPVGWKDAALGTRCSR